MQGKRAVTAILVLVLSACGARTGLGVLSDAGHVDATAPQDAAVDAPVVPDATPARDASVVCTEGDYYIEMTGAAGTRILAAPCPDGGFAVPTSRYGSCGEDGQCVFVSACGGGSIRLRSLGPWNVAPGSWSASITYVPSDGGVRDYEGTLSVDNWPDSGGTVAGDYSGTNKTGTIAGKFCVRQK